MSDYERHIDRAREILGDITEGGADPIISLQRDNTPLGVSLESLYKDFVLKQIEAKVGDDLVDQMRQEDFLDQILQRCRFIIADPDISEEEAADVRAARNGIYRDVILKISNRFDFDISEGPSEIPVDAMNIEELRKAATALYHFFILDRVEMVSKFLADITYKSRASLAKVQRQRLSSSRKELNLRTLRVVLKNPDDAVIVCCLGWIVRNFAEDEFQFGTVIESLGRMLTDDVTVSTVAKLIDPEDAGPYFELMREVREDQNVADAMTGVVRMDLLQKVPRNEKTQDE